VRLGYVDGGLDYRTAAVSQIKQGTGSARDISISMPAAVNQAQAQARVDVMLEEAWAARAHAQFSLPSQFAQFEPGDVIVIGQGRWRIKSIADGDARKIDAVAHEASVYDAPPAATRLASVVLPPIYGPPEVSIMDLAFVTGASTAAPWLAAQATPWPGNLALYKKSGDASFTFNRIISQQATLGTTLNDFQQGLPYRLDYTASLDVELRYGAFASISKDELLNGRNLVAIGTAATGYEVAQFLNAELIAPSTFRLSGWLRGQGGAEPEMLATRTAGATVTLLNAATVQPELSGNEAGLEITWRLGPAQLDHGHASFVEFTFTGQQKALRPLSPAQISYSSSVSGVQLSWIRRGRIDADTWDVSEIPLGEAVESYNLEIRDGAILKRSETVSAANYFYSVANITSDFGAIPTSFTFRVSQVSALTGAGAILERIINV
jgi:Putative phage tail protein